MLFSLVVSLLYGQNSVLRVKYLHIISVIFNKTNLIINISFDSYRYNSYEHSKEKLMGHGVHYGGKVRCIFIEGKKKSYSKTTEKFIHLVIKK